MKKILAFILLIAATRVAAQSNIDTTIKVDLLKAPASPASSLLGIAASDVDKPTDVSAFMLSLQSATSSFTKLPANYAVDIAPYWIFRNSKKGDITTEGFRKSSGKDVFKQTFVLSFAIKNPDSTETGYNPGSMYGGLGFKFSIFRGRYDKTTNDALDKIKKLQDIRLRHLDKVMSGYKANVDPGVIELRQRRKDLFKDKSTPAEINGVRSSPEFKEIDSVLSRRLADFAEQETTEAENELDKEIQQVASEFQTARIGWTWDVAGGISAEFKKRRFNDSKANNAGLWTTFGYTDTSYGSFLGLVRYLYSPDKIFATDNNQNEIGNISTLDAGIRYIYSRPQSKFSISLEAIYRSVLSSNTIDPSWRLILNADYAIWKNQKLTFSFGRNFDGTITKDGNLIAALSFLTGFGNKR